jgi:hypothetical protein
MKNRTRLHRFPIKPSKMHCKIEIDCENRNAVRKTCHDLVLNLPKIFNISPWFVTEISHEEVKIQPKMRIFSNYQKSV